MSIITLLTDFGLQDEYVGVVKGVVLSINPTVCLIDLTHTIEHQNIVQAAQVLGAAYTYFPKGTIHMGIVDPGVGSSRRIVAGQCQGHGFIAPDNGMLPAVWGDHRPDELYYVENRNLFLSTISASFHGRDIFAPVAAHLSLGLEWAQLGPPAEFDRLEKRPITKGEIIDQNTIMGEITAIDHFGNLISNISADQLYQMAGKTSGADVLVQIGKQKINGISSYYQQSETGQLVALIGSRSRLEIALNQGSAAHSLNVTMGAQILVKKARNNGSSK